ncbi:L10-interacting MYB domain-containing protein-like [Prunus yedoensis var. nudiflora]|uniref:L10-interacting MYB domain-containing protein-like n=1 Tax=Prunus yedoensis var. nudiflora TaxID=2094558 RepID=A0A314UR39_PRUYE|nr:L10-interacting MYB domain-containing protein-like [Prunus yedoensis var. nudiflora]
MAPKNVDGEEKVQWPSKHEEFFIHILHDHVKKGDLQASTFKTKSKPRAKQYHTQGLVHYQLLGEIFNTTTATDQLRYASNQLPPNSYKECELENNFLNTGVHIDVDLDNDGVNLEIDHGKGKRKYVTATPPERRPKKWDKMESYLEVCREVMSQRLQSIQKENSVEASSTSKEMYSIEECIGLVEEMGDIENDTFNKMLEKCAC